MLDPVEMLLFVGYVFDFVQCLKCGWTVMDGVQALIFNVLVSSHFLGNFGEILERVHALLFSHFKH